MRNLPVFENLNLRAPEKFGNLAEKLDPADRRMMARELIELIKIDEASMSTWAGEAEGYLDELEADRGNETPQNREQEGSGEEPPPSTELTLTAIIQFSARATDALLGEPDLAKASEPGGEPLAAWVSSQVRTVDPNWASDTDPLVVHMAATGLGWRKRDFDDDEREFHSHFVPSVGTNSIIINANVRSVERAPRLTHQFERYPYEIQRSIQRKKWVDYEPNFDERDPQQPMKFYETDAWLDLDGDEIDEPWTVTIALDDIPEVVRIRPRWSGKTVVDTDDQLYFNPIQRMYPYRMLPDPKGGFFPMGFGKLLKRVQGSADRLLAAITDTAQTEAEDGGILSGMGIGFPDKIEVKNNRIVVLPGDGPLDGRLQMFPRKQVSPGSVQVLEKVTTLGDRIAGTLNLLENAPASMTATLAKGLIDTGTQVQSAVHRRLVSSMTQEFRMFIKMGDAYSMLPDGASIANAGSVAVTADPALATEMQRSALIGFHMEMVKEFAPFGAIDVRAVATEIYRIARVTSGEKFILPPQQPQATPHEKMQGIIGLMKQQNEKIKVTGAVAVQLTQSLLNLVEAAGGMQNNQAALLTMAQLEHTVQQLMSEAGSANSAIDGMAQQPGNSNASGLPSPTSGGNGPNVSGGPPGGPDQTGAGGGAS